MRASTSRRTCCELFW